MASEGPQLPDGMAYLWEWWSELSAARGGGINGLNPIGYPDIDAWARLTSRDPDGEEVTAIMQVDAAFRAALRDDA